LRLHRQRCFDSTQSPAFKKSFSSVCLEVSCFKFSTYFLNLESLHSSSFLSVSRRSLLPYSAFACLSRCTTLINTSEEQALSSEWIINQHKRGASSLEQVDRNQPCVQGTQIGSHHIHEWFVVIADIEVYAPASHMKGAPFLLDF